MLTYLKQFASSAARLQDCGHIEKLKTKLITVAVRLGVDCEVFEMLLIYSYSYCMTQSLMIEGQSLRLMCTIQSDRENGLSTPAVWLGYLQLSIRQVCLLTTVLKRQKFACKTSLKRRGVGVCGLADGLKAMACPFCR